MSIKYYPVISQANADSKREEISQRFLSDIQNILGQSLESVSIEELAKEDLQFIFVKGGGAENYFLEAYRHISDKPVYILSTGYGNSLAASMEILSYLQQHGKAGEILHGDSATVARRLDALSRYYVSKGNIVENLTEDSLCRSQIRIQLDDYDYFTTAPINNHHLICSGDYTDAIREFFTFLNR